jgi:hypothetical protein
MYKHCVTDGHVSCVCTGCMRDEGGKRCRNKPRQREKRIGLVHPQLELPTLMHAAHTYCPMHYMKSNYSRWVRVRPSAQFFAPPTHALESLATLDVLQHALPDQRLHVRPPQEVVCALVQVHWPLLPGDTYILSSEAHPLDEHAALRLLLAKPRRRGRAALTCSVIISPQSCKTRTSMQMSLGGCESHMKSPVSADKHSFACPSESSAQPSLQACAITLTCETVASSRAGYLAI